MSDSMSELFNVEAERAVLGVIFVRPSAFLDTRLEAGDFYLDRHKWIWRAFRELSEDGKTLDYISVSDILESQGRLKEIGGPAYLSGLVSGAPHSTYEPTHAAIVRELSERRKMLALSRQLASAAVDRDNDFEAQVSGVFDALANGMRAPGAAVPIGDWAVEAFSDIVKRVEKGVGEELLLKTGFYHLDRLIGGLDPSEGTMWLLGGSPGAGKTILFSNIAFNLAKKAPGTIYSLEMKRNRLMWRAFSAQTGVSAWAMRAGKLNVKELDSISESVGAYDDMKLFVSDSTEWTTASLRADLVRLKHEHGIRWYGVDYMGLLGDTLRGEKEHERLRVVSRRLLRINRELGLSSIIVHTMTKEGFSSGTGGAGFAGAAGLQYDTDIASILEPEEGMAGIYRKHVLRFVKNRDGEQPLGKVELLKYTDRPLFVNPAAE